MQGQTIEIKTENARKAYEASPEEFKTVLEILFDGKANVSRDIKERCKTFEDVLAITGSNITTGLSKDEIAYKKLKLIAEVLNEGWTPDYGNEREYKYYPYFIWSAAAGRFVCCVYGVTYTGTPLGARLCFKNSDLATYAGKQFETEYNEFFI